MSRLRATNQATSLKRPTQYVFENGQTRREFLANSGIAVLLAGLLVYKPVIAKELIEEESEKVGFSQAQQALIEAVQQQLFPDDGDGPSARDLQAFRYLQWALEDKKNIEDGDPAFIRNGVKWLDAQAEEQFSQEFIALTVTQQYEVLSAFSKSKRGENWMSLLVYYLLEALTLDPIYGGNPEQVGWKWLEHQPGYPSPPAAKTYRYYQGLS